LTNLFWNTVMALELKYKFKKMMMAQLIMLDYLTNLLTN